MWPLNHLEPHLRTIFGFIGVSDVTFIYAGNDMAGGEQLERSITEALVHIRTAVRTSAQSRLAGNALQPCIFTRGDVGAPRHPCLGRDRLI
jgi:hypothetical protein